MDSVRFALAGVVAACFLIGVFSWLLDRHETRRMARLDAMRATESVESSTRRASKM